MTDNVIPMPSALADILNSLIDEAARHEEFQQSTKAQSRLLHTIAAEWNKLPKPVQQNILTRITPMVPRLSNTRDPAKLWGHIVDCYEMYPERGAVEIAKCLKVALPQPTYIGDPEEYLFPKEGWIAEFIKLARESEVPVAFHFWAAVTTLGAACKYKVLIDRAKFDIRMNWYTLLTGSKATGKSLSKDIAADIVDRMNRKLNPIQSKVSGAPLKPQSIRVLAEDSTKESIMEELQHQVIYDKDDKTGLVRMISLDSAGYLLVDELANMLGRQAYGVETKIPFFTALYASSSYRKSTATSTKADLKNCALSMLACCAPDWLLEAVTPVMFRGGFLDRFRIVYRPDNHSKRVYPTPGPTDPVMANILANDLVQWSSLEEDHELFPLKETEDYYNKWYIDKKDEIEQDINGDGLSLHRLANQMWKLSGILAISDGSAPYIGPSHIEMADKILTNEEKFFRYLMQVITQDPLVTQLEDIEDTLLRKGGMVEMIRLHDLLRRKKGFLPWKTCGKMFIQDLIDNGNITKEKFAKVGEKARTYYKLTEVGLSHLQSRNVSKKKIDEARLKIASQLSELEFRRMTQQREGYGDDPPEPPEIPPEPKGEDNDDD